ncbi:U32 family peptidase [Sporolactobacillus shoreicorticis]|uniref:Peptidase U32 family protein n=1 Tax=Sporolactobacillus shoreicorticis TaxID=1923877 RepID=A0ABW5S7Z7_9BACL|nr:peptidase U32 family protein [Sporolactobacillus shoreicorticis]MCO7126955.1 U32 family peptidase [Sporolactobacillus shoreicorticis]
MELIATAESLEQAEALINAGADRLYVGGHPFGLRLPKPLNLESIGQIADLAHRHGKKITVACNALMHNEQIHKLAPYLSQLGKFAVDTVSIGDPGAIFILRELGLPLPFIYDAGTLVTSAEQIAFWISQGASGAISARELTLKELIAMQKKLDRPIEVQVYGPTCIHQSGRPLLKNYFNYTGEVPKNDQTLYLRDPKNSDSHYPIFEDTDGTHIFSTDDLSLMGQLKLMYENGLTKWKLDGVLLHGGRFVQITALFDEARRAIESGAFVPESFCNRLVKLQPAYRPLSTGFYLKNPEDVH